jgi:O-antigen/teichoic acid export membrane protein
MSESRRQLLSLGVFLLIIVAVIVLFAANIIGWTLIIPLILMLSGVWILVLAVMRSSKPQKYERGAFSTLNMGLLMIAVGGAFYLVYFSYWWYALALLLLVLAAIAIAAALKRK